MKDKKIPNPEINHSSEPMEFEPPPKPGSAFHAYHEVSAPLNYHPLPPSKELVEIPRREWEALKEDVRILQSILKEILDSDLTLNIEPCSIYNQRKLEESLSKKEVSDAGT